MSGAVYFVRECPVCGRRLNIRIEYLGRFVLCQHCGGQFIAQDPANGSPYTSEDLLRRAEQLLEQVRRLGSQRRFSHPR